MAIALGKAGYAVAFTYYENEGEAIEVQQTLSTLGMRCACYQAKMEDITAAEQLISRVRREFGQIDVMICNGAMDRRMSILTVTPEQMQFMTTQLYISQILCASRAAQWMVKDGIAGSILFTSSVRAQRADTSDFLYGGMKAALERSCQSLALELAPYGIRVNCIAPGSIDTSGNQETRPCDRVPNRWIDFIRCHISQIGGVTPARKLAAYCEAFGVRTAWHGPNDLSPIGCMANLHLDLTTVNFGIQEWFGLEQYPQIQEVFQGCASVQNGFAYANEPPGWGIEVDEEAARKYPLNSTLASWLFARSPDGAEVRV